MYNHQYMQTLQYSLLPVANLAMANTVLRLLLYCLVWLCASTSAATDEGTLQPLGDKCHLGDVPLGNVIPTAGFEVETMQFLGAVKANSLASDCILKCCDLGPVGCQYIWILWGRCYAVSCSEQTASNCQPMEIPFVTEFDSIYFPVDWSHRAHQEPDAGKAPEGSHEREKGSHEREKGSHERGREGMGGSTGATELVPPVANAGPDVTLVYPQQTSVVLNGSSSSGSNSVSFYLWQLTSEDHLDQATLINPSLPELHILNLTPGEYTFTLTVSDSTLHMSTDTVKVHVIQASSSAAIPSAPPTSPATQPSSSQSSSASPTSQSSSASVALEGTTTQGESLSGEVAEGEVEGVEDSEYSKRSNLLKIAVPVLVSVALILILSAAIVGLTFCLCERNRRRMTHLYRYKKLPGTIERT